MPKRNAQYALQVPAAYEGEVAGAAYFRALAAAYPQHSAFLEKCAALERATADKLGALVGKYRMVARSRRVLEERGAFDARMEAGRDWRELLQQSISSYAKYADEFAALETMGPAEDQAVLAALTAHEVRLIEWMREETAA